MEISPPFRFVLPPRSEPPAGLEDAQRLFEEAEKAVSAFFCGTYSRNTARTYKTALQYWGAWHALRYGESIAAPVTPTVVIQFIVDHLEHQPGLPPAEVSPYTPSSQTTQHLLPLAIDRVLVERGYKAQLGPWSMATVQTRLAALSKAHEQFIANNSHLNLGPEKNPLRDARVRKLISAARRAYMRRGQSPREPVAATRSDIMEALLATCAMI